MLFPTYSLIIITFAESCGLLFPIMTRKITDQCTKIQCIAALRKEKYYLPENLVVGGDCNKS